MTVGTTTDFSMTVAEIVEEALSELGVLGDEEQLPETQQTRAINRLNMMLKAWQADGVYPWTETEDSFTLVQGTVSYTFGAGGTKTYLPFAMKDVRLTRGGTDIPLEEIGRKRYQAIPNKTAEGRPINWFYDRQRDTGVLYLWQPADSGLGTLKYTYRRSLFDIDAATETLDLPQAWHEAVVTNLAKRLIRPYGKSGSPRAKEIREDADRTYAIVSSFANAEGAGSIYLLPDEGD